NDDAGHGLLSDDEDDIGNARRVLRRDGRLRCRVAQGVLVDRDVGPGGADRQIRAEGDAADGVERAAPERVVPDDDAELEVGAAEARQLRDEGADLVAIKWSALAVRR